jgi:hypothetical protein
MDPVPLAHRAADAFQIIVAQHPFRYRLHRLSE